MKHIVVHMNIRLLPVRSSSIVIVLMLMQFAFSLRAFSEIHLSGINSINASLPPPPPSNDDPCGAINLPVADNCNYLFFTNDDATDTEIPDPACSNFNGDDLWFSVTVPASGTLNIDAIAGEMQNGAMAVYTGTCGNLTEIACDNNSSFNPQMPFIALTGLSGGSTIFIRFWRVNGPSGSFGICVTGPPPPPANDEPCSATSLPVGNNCSYIASNSEGATSSSTVANPSCGLYSGGDVWFLLTVPASGMVNITTQAGTVADGAMAAYSGSCGSLTELLCNDDNNGNPEPYLPLSGLTAGATIYIRFWPYGGNPGGSFAICAVDPGVLPPSTGDNCNGATPFCTDTTYNFANNTNTAGLGVIDCLGSTPNPVWYFFQIDQGGDLDIDIQQSSFSGNPLDVDFDLWGPFTSHAQGCAAISSGTASNIDCSYSGSSIEQANVTSAEAGEFYILLLTNFSNAPGAITFNSSTGSTATSNCDILCTASISYPGSPYCKNVSSAQSVSQSGPTGGAYTSSPAGLSINGTTGAITPSSSTTGTYTVTYTVSGAGGCTTTTNVTVNNIPTASAASASYSICSGSSPNIVLSSNQTGTTFSWTGSDGTSGTGTPINEILNNGVCPNVSFTYTVTPINQCEGSPLFIPVTVIPKPESSFTVSTNPVCVDEIATVSFTGTACPNSTFNWTWPSGTTVQSGSGQGPYQIKWATSGTYSAKLQIVSPTGACTSTQTTVDVSVVQPLSAGTNGTLAICPDGLPQNLFNSLGGTPVVGGTWSGPSLLSGGASGTFTPGINTAGIYVYTLPASGNCPAASASVTVTPKTVPVVTISAIGTELNCLYPSLSLSATGAATYEWNGGVSTNNPFVINGPGLYSVTGTAANGCSDTSSISITQNFAPPVATLSSSSMELNCNISSITLTAGGGGTYSWNNGLGNNAVVSAISSGNYTVTVTSPNGCEDIETLVISSDSDVSFTDITASICQGDLYTLPDGSSTGAPGQHPVVLQGSNGCDSTITTTLTVNPGYIIQVNASICNGDSHLLPDGSSVSTPGSYPVTLQASSGCDSTITTNLTINPAINSIVNALICNGDNYLLPDNSSVNSTGNYVVTIQASSGCDSTITTNLTINPAINSTVNASICNSDSYLLPNGLFVLIAGSYAVTIQAASGCDSTITTNLTINPAINSTVNASICNGDNYLLPDNSSVNSTGNYVVTIQAASGCDSTITTNLTINPAINSTVNASICNGDNYLLPDNYSVNSTGNYVVTIQAVSGCDSTITTNLTINPAINLTVNASTCNGENYLLPNGLSVSTAGSYPVTLPSASGCDSIVTTNLVINPVINSTVNASSCNGDSYLLPDGSSVSTAGSYAVTIQAASGCDSTITTNLTINPAINSTVNESICSGDSYLLPNGLPVSTSGSYPVTIQAASGCDSTITTNLTINPAINSTVNASICNGHNYLLADNSSVNSTGNYVVTLQASSGCDSTITTNLTINPAINSTVNAAICSGDSYSLPNGSSVSTAGSYPVTLQASSGCDSTITTNLVVNPEINSTVNVAICSGDSYLLPDGSSVSTSGSYPVTLQASSGCDSTITTNLTINPAINSTVNAAVCSGDSYLLPNGSSVSTAGSYPVTIQAASGCDSTITTNLTVNSVTNSTVNAAICSGDYYFLPDGSSVSTPGSYPVTLQAVSGCDSIITTNLIVNSVINSTVNAAICNGQSYLLPDGSSVSTAGDYVITLISAGGCDSVITTNLTVENGFAISVNAAICSGQNYLLPNGSSVSTAGEYVITLTSAGGCDSVITTNLTVEDGFAISVNAAICSGQSYLLPDGSSVSTAGDYVITLISAGGCDSIITTNLTINSVINSTINAAICSGQSYLLPNGSSVSASGSYLITLVSAGGCDSVITTNLTVNPVINSTVTASICSGQSYLLPDGSSVSNAGDYVITLTSAGGCDSVITTNLTVENGFSISVNAAICSGQSYLLPNGSSVSASGSYLITLVSAGGCDSVITTNLIVNSVINSTVNAAICNGQSYLLPDGSSVSTAGDYVITLISAGGCDSVITTNLTVENGFAISVNAAICSGQNYLLPNGSSVSTAGEYVITLTSAGGCDSVITTNLTVEDGFAISVNAAICSGQSYLLPDGSSVSTAGDYVITLISAGGCDSIITTNLTINSVINSTINAAICSGQSYLLPNGSSVSASGSYLITLVSAGGCDSVITTNLTVNPVINSTVTASICSGQSYLLPDGSSVSNAGDYVITLTSAGGCDSVITTNLTVENGFSISVNAAICSGQSYLLPNGSSVSNAGDYVITLTSAGGCDSIITTNLTVEDGFAISVNAAICSGQSYLLPDGSSVSTPGFYPITLISSGGCDSVITTNLTVNSVINSTVNAEICSGQNYLLPNGSSVSTAGEYVITLTSAGGCDSVITTNLTVENGFAISVNAAICSGQSYLLPDGSSVSNAGDYVITLTSAGGCDSVITTNLTVNSVINSTINAAICSGQSYLLPDGSSVSTAGDYVITLVSGGGCDSIITTNLTVNSVINSTVNASICSGQSYLLPDDSSVSTAGSYPITLTSAGGCDSVITTNLTVENGFAISVDAAICSGQSYLLPDGSSVSTAGSFPITLVSAGGCDSVITTNLTVEDGFAISVNAAICSGQSYLLPDGSSVSTAGDYVFTLISAGGCDSVITTSLTVNSVINSTVNAAICNGQNYLLPDGSSVSTAGGYVITLTSAGGCDSLITTNLIVNSVINSTVNAAICNGQSYLLPDGSSVSTAGDYVITLISAGGCDSVITTNLTVENGFAISVNAAICSGQSYLLPDGSSVSNAGDYVITLISSGGCDSIITTNLTINSVINSTINAAICSGQSYLLPDGSSVSTSGSYPITSISVGGCDSIITTNLTVNSVINSMVTASICSGQSYLLPDGSSVSTAGDYVITLISAGGCDSVITTDLTVNSVINSTVNAEICSGQNYLLPNGSSVSTAGEYVITLTSAGGCDSVITTNLTVNSVINSMVNAAICSGQSYLLPDGSSVSNAGDYVITLISAGGCDSVITTNLTISSVINSTVNASICSGQSYLLPDGSSVSNAGDYVITLTSAGGCDSIITTNLTVENGFAISVNAAICSGQSYLLPDGSSVSNAGDYVITLTSAGGCDSVITTNLTINPAINSTVSAAICSGQNYLLPDGSSVSTAGDYVITLTSAGGCDSLITTNLIVNSVINSTANAAICSGQSYALPDGSSVSNAGSYAITLISVGGCDSVITTNLTVENGFAISVDATICSGQSYLLPDGSSVSTVGSYPVTLISAGGCDSVITINLAINPALNSAMNVSICSGDSYLLPDGTSVNEQGSYPIILQSASGCDSVVTFNLSVNPVFNSTINIELCTGGSYLLPDGTQATQSGNYPITFQSVTGCDSVINFNLNVHAPVVPILLPGSPLSICNGQFIAISANGAQDFRWSPAAGLSDTTGAEIIANPVVSTTYTVTGNLNGCTGDTSIEIIVNPTPEINLQSSLPQICQGNSVEITAAGADNYFWISGNSDCNTCATDIISPEETSIITIVGSSGSCHDTASIQVTVLPTPEAIIHADTIICKNDYAVLSASGGSTYQWHNGMNSPTIKVFPETSTEYTVITANGICRDTASATVHVYELPVIYAGEDTTIHFGEQVNLHAGGTMVDLEWISNLGSLSCIACPDPVAIPADTAEYCVIGTNQYGCKASDCVTINVEVICGELFIPNVFSPAAGGNTSNDCFKLYGTDCIKEMKLIVYDRWGGEVSVITDKRDCWNGTFNGKELNTGVFIYYLQATLLDNTELRREGNVTLLR